MKKVMIIAVMVSAMLMPAQMMAKNNKNNAKARVENRVNNRKNLRVETKRNDRKERKFVSAKPYNKKFMYKKPMRKPAPIIVSRPPAPRPRPLPPPPPRRIYVNNYYDNDVVEAAATIVGIAALASLIVN